MKQATPAPPLAVFAARRGRFAGATASAAAAIRRASLTTAAEAPSASVDSANAVPRHEQQQQASVRIESNSEEQRHHDEEATEQESEDGEKEDETMASAGVHEDNTATEEDEEAGVESDVARVDTNNVNEVTSETPVGNDVADEDNNDDDEVMSEANDEAVRMNNNVAEDKNRDDKEVEEQKNEECDDEQNDKESNSDDDDEGTDEYNEEASEVMDNGGARIGPSGGNDNGDDNGNDNNDAGAFSITGPTMVSESFPARFASWEELEDYIDELGTTTFQLFHKRSSLSVGHRHAMVEASKLKKGKPIDKVNDPEFIPFEWVAYNRVYSCTCGFRNLRRGQGIRNHVVVRGTGCKVKITAAVTYDRDAGVYFLKTKLKGVHNHPCDRERYYSYAENRRFEPALLHEMAAMDARGCKAREILDHASAYMWNKAGMKPLYKMSDVRNALRRHKKHAVAAAAAVTDENNESSAPSQRIGGVTEAARDQQQLQEQERAVLHRAMPSESLDSEDESGSATDQRPENLSWMTTAAGSRSENNTGGEQQRNQRKRRADAITEAAPTTQREAPFSDTPSRGLQKVTLSQFKVLVDSHYSYALAHEDVSLSASSALSVTSKSFCD